MTPDQRWTRLQELSKTTLTPETTLEFTKLVCGPDAEVI